MVKFALAVFNFSLFIEEETEYAFITKTQVNAV
jgi:hypothetical protein